jgi:hypothetical protein
VSVHARDGTAALAPAMIEISSGDNRLKHKPTCGTQHTPERQTRSGVTRGKGMYRWIYLHRTVTFCI